MKQIKDIQNKLRWEEFYDPEFNLDDEKFYLNNKLSKYFIREFQNKVNQYQVSINQTLSKEFIEEFKNKLNLRYVSIYQDISNEFKEKFIYILIISYDFYCLSFSIIALNSKYTHYLHIFLPIHLYLNLIFF